MLKNSSLLATEHRLTTIFVGGAFLFLVLFEGLFIGGRMYTEGVYQKQDFEKEVQFITHRTIGEKGKKPGIGMNALIIDGSGNIIDVHGPIGREDSDEIIDLSIMARVAPDITLEEGGVMMRKVANVGGGTFTIFFRKGGYPIDDIIRDILRFLTLDFLILLPFYFMGRYFVRETLKPVDDNLDSMHHFINDAGHELKTPLAIISGNLQILRDSKKEDKSLVTESISTIQSMTGSLDGLLELVNLKEKKKVVLKLKESIEDEVRKYKNLIEEKNLTVKTDIDAGLQGMIDPKHFSLLFGNILKNAITYNKKGGEIEIIGKKGTLSVRDTGIGMESESLSKIWERFYRAERSGKHAGTGIGLSIVDRIVKLYKWKVRVESEVGKGTIFTLEVK